MNTLLYKSARFPLRMTPEAVEPGAIGLIIDVEQSPRSARGLRVRIRVGDYVSPWIPPGQVEILDEGCWRVAA
jgi:hypothetical protein